MAKLKNCPFCGSKDVFMCYRGTHYGRIAFVKCELCGATSKAYEYFDDGEEVNVSDVGMKRAINAWNRRV